MNKTAQKISEFLKDSGLNRFERLDPSRWVVSVSCDAPEVERFVVDIYLMDNWISFTSIVITNLRGEKLAEFYELLFRLNYYLNGLKFAISTDGGVITLQLELDDAQDLNFERFQSIFRGFTLFYWEWYPKLVQAAVELKLKFRQTQEKTWIDGMLGSLTNSSEDIRFRLGDTERKQATPQLIGNGYNQKNYYH